MASEETILILLRFAEEGAAELDEVSGKLDELGAQAKLVNDETADSMAGVRSATHDAAEGVEDDAGSIASNFSGIGSASDKAEKDIGRDAEKIVEHNSKIAKSGGLISNALSGVANMTSHVPILGKAVKKASEEFDKASGTGGKFVSAMSSLGGATIVGGTVAVVGLAGAALDLGAKFQSAGTLLVTGAGQSQAGLKKVEDGVLSMSGAVGQSATNLMSGLYLVESAGYHGAKGLDVLKAAAQGATVGAAPMATVADALTSALNAYSIPASKAVNVTNELIATTAAGKMHMDALAGSLGSVLPVAASAHISFAQIGGAIATMTSMGMSAHRATMNLATTIRSLENPNKTAVAEMEAMGLNANQVAADLGKQGLTGTMGELSEAILKHMGPAGMVMLNTFNKSQSATADMKTMLDQMTPSARKVALELEHGTISTKAYLTATEGMGEQSATQATQFQTLLGSAQGFNSELTQGGPAAQTYTAALAKITGNAQAMQVALLTTGSHAQMMSANVASIQQAADGSSKTVQGFSLASQDLSFQINSAKDSITALVTKLGIDLLPDVEKLIKLVAEGTNYLLQHKLALIAVAGVIGGVLGLAITVFIATKLVKLYNSLKTGVQAIAGFFSKFSSAGKAGAVEAEANADTINAATDSIEETAETDGPATGLAFDEMIGPIGLLIPVIMLVAQHWKTILHAIEAVAEWLWHRLKPYWDAIRGDVFAVFDFIKKHLAIILPIIVGIILGPIGLMVLELVTHWKAVKKGAEDAWHFVEGILKTAWSIMHPIFGLIVDDIDLVIKAFKFLLDLPSKVSNIAGSIAKHIPGAGVVGSVAHVFGLAEGAVVDKPTFAVIGEHGPEVVLPIHDMNRAMQLLSQAGMLSAIQGQGDAAQTGTFGGSTTIRLSGGAGAHDARFDQLMARLETLYDALTAGMHLDEQQLAEQRNTTRAVVGSANKIANGILNAQDELNDDLANGLHRSIR